MDALRQAFAASASLSDQSHARVLISVSGAKARAMLAKLSSIDLHPAAFPIGSRSRDLDGSHQRHALARQ